MLGPARILVVSDRLSVEDLASLIGNPFPDMVKFVVDVDRGLVAVGGELHSDAEAILLEHGSHQDALWGGNYFPGLGEVECIAYTSLINIRPSRDNPGMNVGDPRLREQIQRIVQARIGRGEPLR